MFWPHTPWALLTLGAGVQMGWFGEAYCVGFFRDLVTLLGKRDLSNLSDLLKSQAELPFHCRCV